MDEKQKVPDKERKDKDDRPKFHPDVTDMDIVEGFSEDPRLSHGH